MTNLGRLSCLSLLGLLSLGLSSGCANYKSQLDRSFGYYGENRYEDALAVLRNLDEDRSSLDPRDQVRYCYVRGMTDYRLGYGDDARYWLGLAKASLPDASDALDEGEKTRMNATLEELSAPIFGLKKAAPGASVAPSGETVPSSAPSAAPVTMPAPAPANDGLTKCQWTSECRIGFVCQTGVCVQAK